MFAPLRSVFAAQLMVCDMKSSSPEVSSAVDAALSVKHCVKMMDGSSADARNEYQNDQTAQSCCGDDGACKGDCHFAVSASLLMQGADYSPVFLGTATFDMISSALLVRELIPPSRPPLSLYS
jgi:hypothetical protein